jgi:hypothetical protein
MGPLLHFIRPFDPFDLQALRILSEAYDKAIASLPPEQPLDVREAIAIRILDLAANGELDIDRLCDGALVECGDKSTERGYEIQKLFAKRPHAISCASGYRRSTSNNSLGVRYTHR